MACIMQAAGGGTLLCKKTRLFVSNIVKITIIYYYHKIVKISKFCDEILELQIYNFFIMQYEIKFSVIKAP
jgi:hypothetical protein